MPCERVKGFLSRQGCTFTVRNVDDDEGAYDALVALGIRAVPVTIIGGEPIKGFDEDRLREALDRFGRSRPAPEDAPTS
jgi:glutaredoxin